MSILDIYKTSEKMFSEKQMDDAYDKGFKDASERMYSEEDLRKAFNQGQEHVDYNDTYGWSSKLTEQEWFEQFKKQNNGR